MSLPEHLEKFLGPIEAGWSRDADGAELPFQVVRFTHGPKPGTTAFATLGLAKLPLRARTNGKPIHHELVIVLPDSMRDGSAPGLLQQIGREAVERGDALLRGDVIGPRGQLFSGDSNMEALYAAIPVYFPHEFASYRDGDRDVVMVWLVPVSRSEAEFVRRRGWDQFENELVRANPDLLDLDRKSLFA